jgi:ubiquinone/menaquinone biosynthesis C-methylase UbiE
MGCTSQTPVADIGAGTGKLTKELVKHGLTVKSVEPNDAMRSIGIRNTQGQSASWSVGTGESTRLPTSSVHAVFFGSSFNVVDQRAALAEVARILSPHGWFACMWNHRNLSDPTQQKIESIIKSFIPGYTYGLRREDPTSVIKSSGQFSPAKSIERTFEWEMLASDIIVAWKSHATLRRQAGSDALFEAIVTDISKYLSRLPKNINVPYTTRIYFAQLTKEKSDRNTLPRSMTS